jgi:hypothetical protein
MPPGWCDRTHTVPSGKVELMAGVSAGLVTAAEVNSQPSPKGSSLDSPSTWATIWFVVSALYLLGIYYGMISVRSHA